MRRLIAGIAGAVFGFGLVLSDMIDPDRVLAFLTLNSGKWDPTLAFVMGGAILPMLLAWRISAQREQPFLGGEFPPRPTGGPDRKLMAGAILFGIGWGVIGLCPGPALAGLLIGGWPVALFVAAAFGGMALYQYQFTRA